MGQVQIIVEGLTASGKSTIVRLLAERLSLRVKGDEFKAQYAILGRFGNDQRWVFPMQLNFLTTRFAQYLMACEGDNSILDRSIFGDLIYADTYRKLRFFTEGQYQTYVGLYDYLQSYVTMPKLMIFPRCSFEEIQKRLRRRNVPGETVASEEFWETLYDAYEKFITNLPSHKKIKNYLVVDTEKANLVDSEEDKVHFVDAVRQRLRA